MKNATYNTAKKTVAYAIAAFSFFALCACSADSSIAGPDTDYSVTSINNNDVEKSVVPVNNRPADLDGREYELRDPFGKLLLRKLCR